MLAGRVSLYLSAALTAWSLSANLANAELVAYWNFDTDFSATVGGPTYDATPTFGASISGVESKWGVGAAHFDKASMAYATTSASPFGTGSHSYSLWFYLDVEATSFAPDRQFAGFGTGGPGDAYTAFFNIDGDEGADPGNDDDILVTRVATNGPGIPPNVVSQLPNPTNHQEWKNLIVTVNYDSDANTTMMEQFLNGVSLGASQALTGQPLESTYVAFGVDRDLVGRFWEGYIDDVAVYDHVLSASEIAALQTGPAVGAAPVPTGDYNGNGTVDAADYVLWRDTLGSTVVAGQGADGSANGTIDTDDYDFWRDRFGNTVPGSGSSSAAVPEPAAAGLVIFAISFSLIRSRTRVWNNEVRNHG